VSCCKFTKEKEMKSDDIYKEFNAMSLDSIYQKAKRDLEDFED